MTPTQKQRPLRYSLNIFQKWLPYWIFVFRCKVFLAKDNTSAAIPTNYLLNLLGYEKESFCAESRNSRWHFLEPSQIKNPTMQHSRKKENDMLWNTRCYRELLIVIFMATFFFSLKTALFFMVLTFFNLKVYCIAVWFFCLPFFFYMHYIDVCHQKCRTTKPDQTTKKTLYKGNYDQWKDFILMDNEQKYKDK